MTNLNLKIDEKIHKEFKKYCIDSNCTMTSKIIELIKTELESIKLLINQSITDKTNKKSKKIN